MYLHVCSPYHTVSPRARSTSPPVRSVVDTSGNPTDSFQRVFSNRDRTGWTAVESSSNYTGVVKLSSSTSNGYQPFPVVPSTVDLYGTDDEDTSMGLHDSQHGLEHPPLTLEQVARERLYLSRLDAPYTEHTDIDELEESNQQFDEHDHYDDPIFDGDREFDHSKATLVQSHQDLMPEGLVLILY